MSYVKKAVHMTLCYITESLKMVATMAGYSLDIITKVLLDEVIYGKPTQLKEKSKSLLQGECKQLGGNWMLYQCYFLYILHFFCFIFISTMYLPYLPMYKIQCQLLPH